MSVDDMREFMDISKEMFEVQLPRLVSEGTQSISI